MMTSSQELVSTLKAQHRTLQVDLNQIYDITQSELHNKGELIVGHLVQFNKDLANHLNVENNEFYPDYLEKKVKRGEDISSTKAFINQMADIGTEVIQFLEKYHTKESIDSSLSTFGKELSMIISTLNTRIETEEEGVFNIYLLL